MRKEPSGDKFVKVAVVSKVPPETMRAVEVNGRRVLIINLEGEIHALDGRCPHRGGPLDQGDLWRGIIECPWHHYRYDVKTGQNLYPRHVYPADLAFLQRDICPVRRYPIQVIGEQIWVAVEGASMDSSVTVITSLKPCPMAER